MNDKIAWERFEKSGRVEDYISYVEKGSAMELLSIKDGSDADKNTGICPKTAEYR